MRDNNDTQIWLNILHNCGNSSSLPSPFSNLDSGRFIGLGFHIMWVMQKSKKTSANVVGLDRASSQVSTVWCAKARIRLP